MGRSRAPRAGSPFGGTRRGFALRLLLVSIVAVAGPPAAADAEPRPLASAFEPAGAFLPAEALPLGCPWGGDDASGGFALDGAAPAASRGGTELRFGGPSGRLSLCSGGPAGADGRLRGLEAEAAAPAAWETRDPREPLRGVRNASAPYGKKLRRGVLIITGTEIASGLVLAAMSSEDTNWDEAPLAHASENFRRAWTTLPAWDRDTYFHDWIGHPYAGAFYYNMIRSQGGTVAQSFAFSCLQSFLWEYVLEAWAEQPSAQDLVSTSLIGSAVGELFHRWSVALLRKGRLNLGQKALVFFLNPSYVINNGFRPPE